MWDGSTACVSLCAFADSIKALYMWHTVTGRTAVPLWPPCVCVSLCVCLCGRVRERNWPSASWLHLLCRDTAHRYSSVISGTSSEAGERRLLNIATIALWTVSPPFLCAEEETLTSSASSLSLLSAEMQASAHEMAAALKPTTLSPISQLKIFENWPQLNKWCLWLEGAALGHFGHFLNVCHQT